MAKSSSSRTSRLWLYIAWGIFFLILAAYSVYWFMARNALSDAVDKWVAAETKRGASVEYSERTLGGFPFRFALTLEDPAYKAANGTKWEGDTLQLVMQPWDFKHIIARSPGRNLVSAKDGVRHTVNLGSKSAGSVSWDDKNIRRIGLQFDDMTALINGEEYAATNFSLNLAPPSGAPNDLRVALQWDALTVPNSPPELAFLGDTAQASRLIADVEGFFPAFAAAGGKFDRLPETLRQSEGRIYLGQLLLNWGALKLGAKGDISAAKQAWNGEISVRLDDAETLRAAMDAAGLPPEPILAVTALEAASADGAFLTLRVRGNEIIFLGQPVASLVPPQG